MAKEKPKSAMANLLDNISQVTPLDGGDVGVTQTSEKNQRNNAAFSLDKIESTSKVLITTDSVLTLTNLDPNQCCPWKFADRPEDEMGDIDALAESIKIHGQQEPILVRPAIDSSKIEYEVIFGNRRWQACKIINKPILAIVKTLTDQEAAVYQKEENENRKDLSDYARAKSYKCQIDAGVFQSEVELSKYLGISTQSLNDIMSFLRVPQEVIQTIPNFKTLSRKIVVKMAALAKHKENIEQLIKLAPKIVSKTVTSSNIESMVIRTAGETRNKQMQQPLIIRSTQGEKILEIKLSKAGEGNIKIAKKLYGKYDKNKLARLVADYLLECENIN